jgi:hypothetical protein
MPLAPLPSSSRHNLVTGTRVNGDTRATAGWADDSYSRTTALPSPR